jgi:hypothetical protein
MTKSGWTWHNLEVGRPIAAPLEQCAELLGVDLATVGELPRVTAVVFVVRWYAAPGWVPASTRCGYLVACVPSCVKSSGHRLYRIVL